MTSIIKSKILTVIKVTNVGNFSEAQHLKCCNQFIITNLQIANGLTYSSVYNENMKN